MLRYPVENLFGHARKSYLSAAPAAAVMVDVEFKNGVKQKTVQGKLDSGMKITYAKIPKSVADELGIKPAEKGTSVSPGGSEEVMIAKIDWITIGKGKGQCSVANAEILIGGDRILIGQPFLAASGAAILYAKEGVKIACLDKGAPGAVGVFPQFSLELSNNGRNATETAIVDTGFDGGLAVPQEIAEKLGLQKLGKKKFLAHSGTVEMEQSKIENVGFPGSKICIASDVEVSIWPADASFKAVMVGEKFMTKLGGGKGAALIYDQEGAMLACFGGGEILRAAKTVYVLTVPMELLPEGATPTIMTPVGGGALPWVLGIAGGAAVAGLAWWTWGSGSRR